MKPNQREDKLYNEGKRSKIEIEEEALFGFLKDISRKGSLLDIGCGTGTSAAVVKNMGFKVFCTDFSFEALKAAKREHALDCYLSDLDSGLPVKNKIFDVVWAADIIEHLFDPIFALSEISRVLKKGGILLAVIPNDLYISNRLRVLLGGSYQHPGYIKFSHYKHHTFFSHNLFRYMLERNNLKIEKRFNIYKLPRISKCIRAAGSGPIANLFSTTLIYKIVKS